MYFGVDEETQERYTTCVRSGNECSGLYISEDTQTCAHEKISCRQLAGEYALEDGDTRLCVSASECNRLGRFVFELEGTCLLPEECRAQGRYAYLETGACERLSVEDASSFDPSLAGKDIYSCGEKYLDVTGFWMKCVTEDECTGMLFKSQKLCVQESQCQSKNPFSSEVGYSYNNGTAKECVSAKECSEKGGYPYKNSRECSTIGPDPSDDKLRIPTDEEYVYQCASGTILFVAESARCISRNECLYGAPRGLRYRDTCVTRQQWLDKDRKNYVAPGPTPATSKKEIPIGAKASDVCNTNYEDDRPDSMVLLGGRICGCPETMYHVEYADDERGVQVHKCASLPETLDRDGMDF